MQACACTDIILNSEDKSWINGRSMEFAVPMQSKVSLYPRGMKYPSSRSSPLTTLAWTSKYGYLAVDCLTQGFTTDGMNEKGFSIGALWFPDAVYPQTDASKPLVALQELGNWLLGNFSTVQEACEALKHLQIAVQPIEPLGIPPIHLVLHDASGESAVIEFLKGEMHIFQNRIGVLTNGPEFPWHLSNLRNFIHLSAVNASSKNLLGVNLPPFGQGTGLLGIPGDWTPPARFVKSSYLKAFSWIPSSARQAVNLLEHLFNCVDIPLGVVRPEPNTSEFTQWVVFKDLTNLIFYYRTYQDLCLKSIDLKKLDFSESAMMTSFPMEQPPVEQDVTHVLQSHSSMPKDL
jgi:choloylglycine hydrolase